MNLKYYSKRPIGTYIGKVFRTLRMTIFKNFEKEGYKITFEQWLILLFLNIKDGQTQRELSLASMKEKTSTTRLIDRLEKKKLILRKQDKADRRNNRIFMTKEGKRIIEILIPLAMEVHQTALNGFSDKEKYLMTDFLDRMYNNLCNK